MGTILLHVGMPKTGSSSIQQWLDEHSSMLRAEREIHLLVAAPRRDDPQAQSLLLVPYEPGRVHSSFVRNGAGYYPRAPVDRHFFDALDLHTRRHGTTLLTGEGFSALFWGPNDANLAALNELTEVHDIRVVYYVRPQHTTMEAWWRQWGFRTGLKPARYLWYLCQRRRLRYLQTLERVRRIAPGVAFEMRPFRPDLMRDGDVVADFVSAFLGIDYVWSVASGERRANVGLPLELAILLQQAPPGEFWSSPHDNRELVELADVVASWDLPETPRVRRSRLVLQQYCHERFEADNQQLIKKLGWHTRYFVPPVDNASELGLGGIAELNDLWNADASEGERHILFLALSQLVESKRHRSAEPARRVQVGMNRSRVARARAVLARHLRGQTTGGCRTG